MSGVIELSEDEDIVFLHTSQRPAARPAQAEEARTRRTPLFADPSPPSSPEAAASRPFKKQKSEVISLEDDDEDFSILDLDTVRNSAQAGPSSARIADRPNTLPSRYPSLENVASLGAAERIRHTTSQEKPADTPSGKNPAANLPVGTPPSSTQLASSSKTPRQETATTLPAAQTQLDNPVSLSHMTLEAIQAYLGGFSRRSGSDVASAGTPARSSAATSDLAMGSNRGGTSRAVTDGTVSETSKGGIGGPSAVRSGSRVQGELVVPPGLNLPAQPAQPTRSEDKGKGKQPEWRALPPALQQAATPSKASGSPSTSVASQRSSKHRGSRRNVAEVDPYEQVQMPFQAPAQLEDVDLPAIPDMPMKPIANLSIFKSKSSKNWTKASFVPKSITTDRSTEAPSSTKVPAAQPRPAVVSPARPKDRPYWRTIGDASSDDDGSQAPSTGETGQLDSAFDIPAGNEPGPSIGTKPETPTVRFDLSPEPHSADSERTKRQNVAASRTAMSIRGKAKQARKSMGSRGGLPTRTSPVRTSEAELPSSPPEEVPQIKQARKTMGSRGGLPSRPLPAAAPEERSRSSSPLEHMQVDAFDMQVDSPMASPEPAEPVKPTVAVHESPKPHPIVLIAAPVEESRQEPLVETHFPTSLAVGLIDSPPTHPLQASAGEKASAKIAATLEESTTSTAKASVDSTADQAPRAAEQDAMEVDSVLPEDAAEESAVEEMSSDPQESEAAKQAMTSPTPPAAPTAPIASRLAVAVGQERWADQAPPPFPSPAELSKNALAANPTAEAGSSRTEELASLSLERQLSSERTAEVPAAQETRAEIPQASPAQETTISGGIALPPGLRARPPSEPFEASVTAPSTVPDIVAPEPVGSALTTVSTPAAVAAALPEATPGAQPARSTPEVQPAEQMIIDVPALTPENPVSHGSSDEVISQSVSRSISQTTSPAPSAAEPDDIIVIKRAPPRVVQDPPQSLARTVLTANLPKVDYVEFALEGRKQTRGAARSGSPAPFALTTDERLTQWEHQLGGQGDGALNIVDQLLAEDSFSDQDDSLPGPVTITKPAVTAREANLPAGAKNALEAVRYASVAHSKSARKEAVVAHPHDTRTLLQGLSFERFGDPLLQQINILAKDESQTELVRTIMEAYISQASLKDQGRDVTIAPGIFRKGITMARAPPAEFVYSNDMFYGKTVGPKVKSKGCGCVGPCRENSDCFCLKRQEKYFASIVYEGTEPYTGFACHEDGRIKDPQYPTWECSDECGCPPSCRNRSMQRGRDPKIQLEIFETRQKGWGVRTKTAILQGTFIGIYTGELVPEAETDARGRIYNAVGRTYLFDLDHWHISQPPADLGEIDPEGARAAQEAAKLLQESRDTDNEDVDADDDDDDMALTSFYTVDAFHWGFTRYLNHSCDPNLAMGSAYFDDFDVRKPKLCITAKRDIPAGQELTITYLGDVEGDLMESSSQVGTDMSLRTPRGKNKDGKLQDPHTGSVHVDTSTDLPTTCYCKAWNCKGTMFRTNR